MSHTFVSERLLLQKDYSVFQKILHCKTKTDAKYWTIKLHVYKEFGIHNLWYLFMQVATSRHEG